MHMYPSNEEKKNFIIEWENYCYKLVILTLKMLEQSINL